MSPKDISLLHHLKNLVDNAPDNVYHGDDDDCCYSTGQCSNGSVGCIIGQALALNGHTHDELADIDNDCFGFRGAFEVLQELGYDYNVAQFCQSIQTEQDSYGTWRCAWDDAVKHFDIQQYLGVDTV